MPRRPFIAMSAAAALVLAGVVGAAAPAQAAAPVPDSDTFYAVPADVGDAAAGTVLRARSVQIPVTSGVIGAASAQQLLYRTVDNHGDPTATVATVIRPVVPWLGKGPRPLLSYQSAEDGLGTSCAPSYSMTSGSALFALEAVNVTQALAQGWVVVVPDYEGPGSEFLGATGQPREVLDAVRATLSSPSSELSAGSPVGLWGQSGGAFATALAAQVQPAYAPELHIEAAVTAALPADLNPAFAALAGDPTAPLIPFLLAALEHAYPEAHLDQYLSAAGQQQVAAVAGDCFTDAQGQGSQVSSLASIEAYPGSLTAGAFVDFVRAHSPAGAAGTPSVRIIDVHGLLDQIAPLPADRALMNAYCAAGVRVTHVEVPGEHTTSMVLAGPVAIATLGATFAGRPPVSSCGAIPTS
jgi:hypothetical protein